VAETVIEPELLGEARHLAALLLVDEGHRDAVATGPAGAPHPVDVGLVVGGGVEVDDVGDPVDVDPARGHVGGDEHVDLATLESGEGDLALTLGLVAVHRDGGHALARQALDQAVGAVLGAHEHQRELAFARQLLDERVEPIGAAEAAEAVIDGLGGAPRRRTMLVDGRIGRVAAGHATGLAVERRREEQRLTVRRAGADDTVDGGLEAHVEHPVGLVEHEHLDVVEGEGAAGEQVLEATGGRDEQVRAGGVLGLRSQPDAAVDGGDAQRPGLGQRAQLVGDLGGEFPRGREHERGRTARLGGDPVDERDPEGEGLARSGGRAHEHVTTGEHVADGEALDRERLGDARAREGVDDGAGHAEIGKGRH
jgi:hypothetical protein